jgi:hypothetical protein
MSATAFKGFNQTRLTRLRACGGTYHFQGGLESGKTLNQNRCVYPAWLKIAQP